MTDEERLKAVLSSPRFQALRVREILDVEVGKAVVEYDASPDWLIPNGAVQGGFVAGMIDHAMAVAARTVLDPEHGHPTIELKVNYFKPAPAGKLIARSEVLRLGKQTLYVEATLEDPAGTMLAKGTSTMMVIRNGSRSP